MKRLYVLIFCLGALSLATQTSAHNTDTASSSGAFSGCSGGMMIHAGYQFNKAQDLHTFAWGLGGLARVHLFNHWRIGGEGYVSNIPYLQEPQGSNTRLGWGGLLMDYYADCDKITPYIGTTIGGGAQRTMHLLADADPANGIAPAEFCKQSFAAICPFIGIEYAATQRLHLVVRLDYLFCVHQSNLLSPQGPRLYFGLMFTH